MKTRNNDKSVDFWLLIKQGQHFSMRPCNLKPNPHWVNQTIVL